jgi:general secretion pathway protein G
MQTTTNTHSRLAHARAGFSFIEIVAVFLIIGVLAAVTVPAYWKFLERARVSNAESTIQNLKLGIMQFSVDTGTYPHALKDLETRPSDERVNKKWRGPYIEEVPEMDPWGNPYVYRLTPGAKHPYELYSHGKNAEEGSKEERLGQWNQ